MIAFLVSLIAFFPVVCNLLMGGPDVCWEFAIMSVVVALPIIHLLCSIRNKVFFLVALFVLLFISMIESYLALISNNFISAGNIISAFNTNGTETEGFLKANGWAILCSLPLIVPYVFAWRKWTAPAHRRYHLIAALITGILTIVYASVGGNLLRKTPYNFVNQVVRLVDITTDKKYISESNDFVFGATRDSVPAANEIYVLGIGESLRYGHVSIDGVYSRETTPLLAENPSVKLFHNYYAAAPMTLFAVPLILTRGTAEDFTRVYQEKTISQAFAECGFKSVVIAHKNNMMGSEAFLSRGAERIVISEDSIVPQLIDSLASIYPKLFVVAHFWGNHYPYFYTDDCNIFHPNEKDAITRVRAEHYINGYDNAIRYTDKILSRIIWSIDRANTESAFLFVADHGENITDKGALHSTMYNPPRCEYHAPLLVWNSALWQTTYSDKQAALEAHQHAPISADNVFYSLCDMANIDIPNDAEQIAAMSIFSSAWKPRTRYCMRSDGTYIELK